LYAGPSASGNLPQPSTTASSLRATIGMRKPNSVMAEHIRSTTWSFRRRLRA
jgi:hypothetical protein